MKTYKLNDLVVEPLPSGRFVGATIIRPSRRPKSFEGHETLVLLPGGAKTVCRMGDFPRNVQQLNKHDRKLWCSLTEFPIAELNKLMAVEKRLADQAEKQHEIAELRRRAAIVGMKVVPA